MAQDGSDGLGGPTEAANAIPPGERSTLELAHVLLAQAEALAEVGPEYLLAAEAIVAAIRATLALVSIAEEVAELRKASMT